MSLLLEKTGGGNMKKVYKFIFCLILFLTIISTSFFGMSYFFIIDPEKNWVNVFTSIVEGNRWICAVGLTLSYLFNIYLLSRKLSETY